MVPVLFVVGVCNVVNVLVEAKRLELAFITKARPPFAMKSLRPYSPRSGKFYVYDTVQKAIL